MFLVGVIAAFGAAGIALVIVGMSTAPPFAFGRPPVVPPTDWPPTPSTPSPRTSVVVGLAVLAVGLVTGLCALVRPAAAVVPLAAGGLVAWWWFPDPGSGTALPLAVGVAAASIVVIAVGRWTSPVRGDVDRVRAARADRMGRRAVLTAGIAAAVLCVVGGVPFFRTRSDGGAPSPGADPEPAAGGGRGPVVDVRSLGAAGDGRTDDTDAVRRAADAARRSSGTVSVPPGTYRLSAGAPIVLDGVVLLGVPGESILEIAAPPTRPSSAVAAFVATGSGTRLDGVTIRRVDDVECVLIGLDGTSGFAMRACAIEDGVDSARPSPCYGVKFPDSGTVQDSSLVDCSFDSLRYGLFQTIQSVAVTRRFTVERCSFGNGRHTDLEFNSPNGRTEGVRVADCSFRDNASEGFGVGLANVIGADVVDNRFENYAQEAVHVEDFTRTVRVQGNEFVSCGLRQHSTVQILSNSSDIQVVDNAFRNLENRNIVYGMTAQAGGIGLNTSGRPIGSPTEVVVERNLFECSSTVTPLYFEQVARGRVEGNVVVSESSINRDLAFVVTGPGEVTIRANVVNGAV